MAKRDAQLESLRALREFGGEDTLIDLAADLEKENERIRKALTDAAKSLEWIAGCKASADEGRTTLDAFMEIRRYAESRAGVARRALASGGEGAGP